MSEINKILNKNKLLSHILIYVFIIFIVVLGVVSNSQNIMQNKDKLLDKKKQIETEIDYYKKLINDTKKNKDISLTQLNLIKNQISKREELISDINAEIRQVDREIENNNIIVEKQNANLSLIKQEYAKMIYFSYFKNKNFYNRLMFIFSAKDFNQAYQRLKYFQQFNEFRNNEFEQINSTTKYIEEKNNELIKQKNNKSDLLETSQKEMTKLGSEVEEKSKVVKQLKQQEASLVKSLKQKQQEAAKLQKKIESIINFEISASAKKTNKKVTTNTTINNVLTTEEKSLSNNFIGNKGKLPWPLDKGAVTGYFGEHAHPDLPGIKVKNNGIDITTNSNEVKSVFGGIVSGVFSITSNNKGIIIRHGDFFTVYTNLASICVSKGDNISTKQVIGALASEEGKKELHFEVWQGKLMLNPLTWLSKK